MSSISSIAASGMSFQIQRLATTANNIANAGTPGYQALVVNAQEASVSNAGQRANGLMEQYGQGVESTGGESSGSEVDTSSELANLLQEKIAFKANAAVEKSANWMLDAILSM